MKYDRHARETLVGEIPLLRGIQFAAVSLWPSLGKVAPAVTEKVGRPINIRLEDNTKYHRFKGTKRQLDKM